MEAVKVSSSDYDASNHLPTLQDKFREIDRAFVESTRAVVELAKLQQAQVDELVSQRRKIERQRWWNRALVVVAIVLLVRLLTGCGGAPFEQESSAGSSFTGAEAGAVSSEAGGSFLPSGGAGGVAGGNAAGNSAGAAGDPPSVLAGAGGALEQPEPPRPCDVSAWKASAFASSPTSTPALAIDGDTSTRWQSGTNQQPGQAFALELGRGAVDLVELELQAPDAGSDLPSSFALELDGKRVDVHATTAPGVVRLAFEAPPASTVRLVLTSSAPAWWSIAEIGGLCR